MKTETRYVCEVCQTAYTDPERAIRCENSGIDPVWPVGMLFGMAQSRESSFRDFTFVVAEEGERVNVHTYPQRAWIARDGHAGDTLPPGRTAPGLGEGFKPCRPDPRLPSFERLVLACWDARVGPLTVWDGQAIVPLDDFLAAAGAPNPLRSWVVRLHLLRGELSEHEYGRICKIAGEVPYEVGDLAWSFSTRGPSVEKVIARVITCLYGAYQERYTLDVSYLPREGVTFRPGEDSAPIDSCDCFDGCWRAHSASWPTLVFTSQADARRAYELCVKEAVHGGYVLAERELRLATADLAMQIADRWGASRPTPTVGGLVGTSA